MCLKKLSLGSRLMVMSIVLLALVLSPLAAWPFSFGKTAPEETTYQVLPSQGAPTSDSDQALIQSLKLKNEELIKVLSEQEAKLKTYEESLQKQIKAEGTTSQNSNVSLMSLLKEIESLKGLSTTYKASYAKVKTDYDELKLAYDAVVVERNTYFQEATEAVAVANSPEKASFHFAMGSAAIYRPSNKDLGLETNVGFGYGDAMITIGAIYNLEKGFKLTDISLDDVSYRIGLQIGF